MKKDGLTKIQSRIISALETYTKMSHGELMECLSDSATTREALAMHIGVLRRKGYRISTIYGYGYALPRHPRDKVSGSLRLQVLEMLEEGPVTVDEFRQAIWPGCDKRTARHNVSHTVYALRGHGAIIDYPYGSGVVTLMGWKEEESAA